MAGPDFIGARLTWGWLNTGDAQLTIEDADNGRRIAVVRVRGEDVGALLGSRGLQDGTVQVHDTRGRPLEGTPEYDLWVTAIDVAISPPVDMRQPTTQVHARRIRALRDALEAVGIDWKTARERNEVQT